MSQQRYIPPHRRRDFSGGEGEKQHPSRPRFWTQQDIVVTLKSSSKYPALPGQLIEIKPSSSDILCQKFKLVFQEDKLRELLRDLRSMKTVVAGDLIVSVGRAFKKTGKSFLIFKPDLQLLISIWFRNIGREDTKAVLEFPPCLSKGQRKDIHVLADKFGLGTSSQGFGDQRYLCMYTVEVAALGVGKISLSQDEKRKSDEVWYLVQKFGGKYGKHSHNEINEMILADSLHPDLQDLLDQNQDILAEEFAEKCQITSTRE